MSETVCGNAHPELLTEHDRQEIRDFRRFLQSEWSDMNNYKTHVTLIDPFWHRYMTGEAPAPPLLGEFYD